MEKVERLLAIDLVLMDQERSSTMWTDSCWICTSPLVTVPSLCMMNHCSFCWVPAWSCHQQTWRNLSCALLHRRESAWLRAVDWALSTWPSLFEGPPFHLLLRLGSSAAYAPSAVIHSLRLKCVVMVLKTVTSFQWQTLSDVTGHLAHSQLVPSPSITASLNLCQSECLKQSWRAGKAPAGQVLSSFRTSLVHLTSSLYAGISITEMLSECLRWGWSSTQYAPGMFV